MVHETDEYLMEMVQKGDNKSLELLYDKHKKTLINFFYRMSGDIHTSENLLQETFTRVYLYRNSFSIDKIFFPWLYQIARNTWADHYKKKKKNPVFADNELQSVSKISPGFEEQHDTQQLILFALQQLSENDRQLVILYHLKGLNYTEMSTMFQMTEGNLRVKLCRALKTLGAILKNSGYEYK
jgi:RNA polymerase sigma-70 factor (ECF subfamily)